MSLEPRLSFNSVAELYERSRPGYAPDAVAWVAKRLPMGRVLDLGAGTGKLTRQLVPYAESVVVVEPGDEMRGVLQRLLPDVELLNGTAEAIPLPDESVDAVTVAQAFHWFELETALAEMHRVLRPGGGFALLWNEWDLPELNAIVDRLRQRPARDDEAYARLKGTPLFANFEEPSFRHVERVDVETVLERVSSISAVITASAENRAAALTDVRSLLGTGTIDFPMLTSVIAADRV
jgi:ubiquinone/menaquinone biosynthesis C-methylase UbiE